ncbi:ABC transporter permease [Chitinophagaceae bacterium LWZ2-11]
MLKNYFKTAWRNLLKNRLSSLINIIGLGLAVGCCLVVFVFIDCNINQDNFHPKRDKIYVVERIESKDGDNQLWGNSPAPMGQMLKEDFPQIKNSARLDFMEAIIKRDDDVFKENLGFVDNSFYDMFNFPVKWGDKKTFTEQDGIVLSNEFSEKLFGKENPIGKNISARFNVAGKEMVENFIVKGVFEKRPRETSFYFTALIPFSRMTSLGINKTENWEKYVNVTFLETADVNTKLPNDAQIKKYVDLYNAANKDIKIVGYNFQPLKSIFFHAARVNFENFNSSDIIGIIMLLAIGLAILILVCFNYMNIAVASSSYRVKEIGVRKTIGSSRLQIIFQFLLENFILCSIGAILGLFLARALFVPWFGQISNFDYAEGMFSNGRLWPALLCLVIIIVLGGAAYPAVYVSSLKPISIVKGQSALPGKNRFRKVLLGFQFFITFLGISMTLAFIRESKIARAKSWGYEPENNVVVKMSASTNFDFFKSQLKNDRKIISVTGSVQPLGNWSKQMMIKSEGKEQAVQTLQVLPQFASQLGIKIMNGRDLSDEFETDKTSSVLVNEAFLKKMNWASGVGKSIEYAGRKYIIVGETNDFRFEDFKDKVMPIMIFGCKPEEVRFAYIKTTSGLFKEAHSTVRGIWKKTFPDSPFDYYYQDTVFEDYFNGFIQISKVMGVTSIVMMIISISGIFGLALLILGKKMKEISVRKVLGAGIGNISFQIIKEFTYAIGGAFVFAILIYYLLIKSIFDQYIPESKVSFLPLAMAFVVILFMTTVSVLWHLYKAYTANPTTYLKND